MSSIFDTVTQQLAGANLSQLSQHIGADEATTSQAVQTALPMLLSGLARNASQPNGATALSDALADHADGSALGNLGGLSAMRSRVWEQASSGTSSATSAMPSNREWETRLD